VSIFGYSTRAATVLVPSNSWPIFEEDLKDEVQLVNSISSLSKKGNFEGLVRIM